MRVLITGSRSYAALEMARHFKGAGWEVYAADCVRFPVCRGSRAVTQSFLLPSPRQDLRGFVDGLIRIIKQYRIDLLMPSSEEIFYIASGLDRLRNHCRVYCEDLEKLRLLHNKWEFSRLTAGCWVQSPGTILLTSPADVERLLAFEKRYVLKPVYGRFAARNRFGSEDFRQVRPGKDDPWLAQEYVQGVEYCSYHLAVAGEIKAHACYRPIHRWGKASGYYFQPVEKPGIARFAEEIARKLRFTGHLAFDFIEAPSGALYVLECNPRATSGIHLLAPGELTGPFSSGKRGAPRRDGRPKMIGYAMFLRPFDRGIRGFRRWAADFARAEDVLFDPRDPWVPLYHLFSLFETLCVSVSRGVGFKDAATADIEWDGEDIKPCE